MVCLHCKGLVALCGWIRYPDGDTRCKVYYVHCSCVNVAFYLQIAQHFILRLAVGQLTKTEPGTNEPSVIQHSVDLA